MSNFLEADRVGAPLAALGTVRSVAGELVTVEVIGAGGSSALVALPAVHHAPYAAGDRVLVLFQGSEPSSAVVAGRVGVLTDAVDATVFLHADGSVPLTGDWDAGTGRHVALEELRARSAAGLLLADASGAAGILVANGGRVGMGVSAPDGVLQLWDGLGGHLFCTRSGIGATAQIIINDGPGGVVEYVRIDAVVSNGTVRAFQSFSLQQGGTTTQNITTGSDVWQFRLLINGSLDVRRISGSGTARVLVRAMWF